MFLPATIGAQLLFAAIAGAGHLEEVGLDHQLGSDCLETRPECLDTCTGRDSIGISRDR